MRAFSDDAVLVKHFDVQRFEYSLLMLFSDCRNTTIWKSDAKFSFAYSPGRQLIFVATKKEVQAISTQSWETVSTSQKETEGLNDIHLSNADFINHSSTNDYWQAIGRPAKLETYRGGADYVE